MKIVQSAVICDMVMRKNINLVLGHFYEKSFTQMSYHVRRFTEFVEVREGLGFDKIQINHKNHQSFILE
jgi:hypothetical protein